MTPTPEGIITGSQIWTATPEEITPVVEELELIEEEVNGDLDSDSKD
jgi:hypothetical protein